MIKSRTVRFLRWFDSPLGRSLVARERALLLNGVRRLHGDLMVWMGPVPVAELELERCMVRHRLFAALDPELGDARVMGGNCSTFRARPEHLPLPSGSADGIVLHHALDCAVDNRTAVREISRVLRPGGRLLVCGFNPWSLWGLRSAWARLVPDDFTGARLVSPGRLLDWLAVLGFEVDDGIQYAVFGPPFQAGRHDSPRWARAGSALERSKLPFGGVYFLLARKTALSVTPLRTVGGRRSVLTPVPMPKPTTRHSS